MKRIVLFCSFLAMWLGMSAQTNTRSNLPFINPTPGEISLMAVSPFPDGIAPTLEGYKEVVDCGFNLVTAVGSVNYFKEQFDMIKELPLKYLVSSPDLRTDKRNNFVTQLKSYPQLGGWLFKDEPRFNDLKALRTQYEALHRADPNHLIYMNLAGRRDKIFMGDLKTYSSYLNLIEDTFYPPIWSYDIYAIYSKKGKVNVSYDYFYEDLETVSAMAKKTKRPFWSFCAAISFKRGDTMWPAPTEAYLRFQAFSALAYGAQGIVYWSYGMRKSSDTETFYSALVNLDGKKSPAWYAAQKVNREIKKFNYIFYECELQHVRHTGDKTYSGTQKLTGSFGPFASVKSGSAGVMLSSVKKDDVTYIIVINHDILKSQKVTLELAKNREASDITGVEKKYTSNAPIIINLDKGGYAILKVTH